VLKRQAEPAPAVIVPVYTMVELCCVLWLCALHLRCVLVLLCTFVHVHVCTHHVSHRPCTAAAHSEQQSSAVALNSDTSLGLR
jgi:hypothetical protein